MTASEPEPQSADLQWYLARDGKQHGPLTNAEMTKLVELGHLRASDLVWRAGFPDWRIATSVFPSVSAPPAARAPAAAAPQPQVASAIAEPTTVRTQPAAAPIAQAAAPAASPYAPPQDLLEPQPSYRQSPYSVDPNAYAGSPRMAPSTASRAAAHYADQNFDRAPDDRYAHAAPKPPRSRKGFAFGVLTTLALIIGGGWVMKDPLLAALKGDEPKKSASKQTPKVTAPAGPSRTAAESDSAAAASAVGGAPPTAVASFETASRQLDGPPPRSANDIDAELQSRRLWATVKQDFPEWYSVRVNEAARLAIDGKSRAEILRHLMEALVGMRRDNASHALAASAEKHRQLASAFLGNLKELSQENSQTCYDFISKGELSPTIVSRIEKPEQATGIEGQLAIILSAITEGRKSPVTHAPPGKADYDVLATELARIGWTQADMQLFADPKALAKASHEKVCKMLQDWFTAHLAVPDPKVQERLLFETLKPVISG